MEFLQEEFDEILEIFKVESEEIVQRFNDNLLSIEKSPGNVDIIMELFRDAHSIKGAARMIGFNNIQTLAHKIEDVLGLAKEGMLLINQEVSSTIYKATDYISYLIQESVKYKKEFITKDLNEHLKALNKIIEKSSDIKLEEPETPLKTESEIDLLIQEVSEKSTSKPQKSTEKPKDKKIEKPSKEPSFQIEKDEVKHKIELIKNSILCLSKGLIYLTELRPELESFIKLNNHKELDIIYELIIKILENIEEQNTLPGEDITKNLAEITEKAILIMTDQTTGEDMQLLEQRLKITLEMIGFSSLQTKGTKMEQAENPLPQYQKAQSFFKTYETGTIKTLRVDTQKLDQLVNQIGELIISKMKTKNHMSELERIKTELDDWYSFSYKSINYIKYYDKKLSSKNDPEDSEGVMNFTRQILHLYEESSISIYELNQKINRLHKQIQDDDVKFSHIVDDLEHMVKNIRVLPLATVFHMFPRMVRDIALEKGKDVELFISGSETSADKKIIEEIKTPLIHIIRNAIDHGIETPAERKRLGKPATGKIQLSAKHVENKIIIEVTDDGHGINLDKIKDKAIRKGLLTQEEMHSMTNSQIMNLIFWPGFSTEDTVTELSGRGIGLDVVQTKIAQLNGSVKVLSTLSQYSRVVIELPITMATLKSFIISVENQIFAIPMNTIKTVIWVKNEDIFIKDGHQTIIHNDKTMPVFDLAAILNIKKGKESPVKQTIIIIEHENTTVGFIVDKLLGDQEILHKKLSPPIYKIKNISGITTLASGEVCLILNISDILKSSFSDNNDIQMLKNIDTQRKNISKTKNSAYKILVVDDSATTRTLLKNILLTAGYDFKLANNPIDAMKRMTYDMFDLIITDIEMPQMNGWEFCKYLRNDENYHKAPIIVLTSINKEEAIAKTVQYGASACIHKSLFNQEEFLYLLGDLLKQL